MASYLLAGIRFSEEGERAQREEVMASLARLRAQLEGDPAEEQLLRAVGQWAQERQHAARAEHLFLHQAEQDARLREAELDRSRERAAAQLTRREAVVDGRARALLWAYRRRRAQHRDMLHQKEKEDIQAKEDAQTERQNELLQKQQQIVELKKKLADLDEELQCVKKKTKNKHAAKARQLQEHYDKKRAHLEHIVGTQAKKIAALGTRIVSAEAAHTALTAELDRVTQECQKELEEAGLKQADMLDQEKRRIFEQQQREARELDRVKEERLALERARQHREGLQARNRKLKMELTDAEKKVGVNNPQHEERNLRLRALAQETKCLDEEAEAMETQLEAIGVDISADQQYIKKKGWKILTVKEASEINLPDSKDIEDKKQQNQALQIQIKNLKKQQAKVEEALQHFKKDQEAREKENKQPDLNRQGSSSRSVLMEKKVAEIGGVMFAVQQNGDTMNTSAQVHKLLVDYTPVTSALEEVDAAVLALTARAAALAGVPGTGARDLRRRAARAKSSAFERAAQTRAELQKMEDDLNSFLEVMASTGAADGNEAHQDSLVEVRDKLSITKLAARGAAEMVRVNALLVVLAQAGETGGERSRQLYAGLNRTLVEYMTGNAKMTKEILVKCLIAICDFVVEYGKGKGITISDDLTEDVQSLVAAGCWEPAAGVLCAADHLAALHLLGLANAPPGDPEVEAFRTKLAQFFENGKPISDDVKMKAAGALCAGRDRAADGPAEDRALALVDAALRAIHFFAEKESVELECFRDYEHFFLSFLSSKENQELTESSTAATTINYDALDFSSSDDDEEKDESEEDDDFDSSEEDDLRDAGDQKNMKDNESTQLENEEENTSLVEKKEEAKEITNQDDKGKKSPEQTPESSDDSNSITNEKKKKNPVIKSQKKREKEIKKILKASNKAEQKNIKFLKAIHKNSKFISGILSKAPESLGSIEGLNDEMVLCLEQLQEVIPADDDGKLNTSEAEKRLIDQKGRLEHILTAVTQVVTASASQLLPDIGQENTTTTYELASSLMKASYELKALAPALDLKALTSQGAAPQAPTATNASQPRAGGGRAGKAGRRKRSPPRMGAKRGPQKIGVTSSFSSDKEKDNEGKNEEEEEKEEKEKNPLFCSSSSSSESSLDSDSDSNVQPPGGVSAATQRLQRLSPQLKTIVYGPPDEKAQRHQGIEAPATPSGRSILKQSLADSGNNKDGGGNRSKPSANAAVLQGMGPTEKLLAISCYDGDETQEETIDDQSSDADSSLAKDHMNKTENERGINEDLDMEVERAKKLKRAAKQLEKNIKRLELLDYTLGELKREIKSKKKIVTKLEKLLHKVRRLTQGRSSRKAKSSGQPNSSREAALTRRAEQERLVYLMETVGMSHAERREVEARTEEMREEVKNNRQKIWMLRRKYDKLNKEQKREKNILVKLPITPNTPASLTESTVPILNLADEAGQALRSPTMMEGSASSTPKHMAYKYFAPIPARTMNLPSQAETPKLTELGRRILFKTGIMHKMRVQSSPKQQRNKEGQEDESYTLDLGNSETEITDDDSLSSLTAVEIAATTQKTLARHIEEPRRIPNVSPLGGLSGFMNALVMLRKKITERKDRPPTTIMTILQQNKCPVTIESESREPEHSMFSKDAKAQGFCPLVVETDSSASEAPAAIAKEQATTINTPAIQMFGDRSGSPAGLITIREGEELGGWRGGGRGGEDGDEDKVTACQAQLMRFAMARQQTAVATEEGGVGTGGGGGAREGGGGVAAVVVPARPTGPPPKKKRARRAAQQQPTAAAASTFGDSNK